MRARATRAFVSWVAGVINGYSQQAPEHVRRLFWSLVKDAVNFGFFSEDVFPDLEEKV